MLYDDRRSDGRVLWLLAFGALLAFLLYAQASMQRHERTLKLIEYKQTCLQLSVELDECSTFIKELR